MATKQTRKIKRLIKKYNNEIISQAEDFYFERKYDEAVIYINYLISPYAWPAI